MQKPEHTENQMDNINTNTQTNPFKNANAQGSPDPCIMVIFGASGDLTKKKILPAIYNLKRNAQLPTNFACVGFARRSISDDDFRAQVTDHVNQYSRIKPKDQAEINHFTETCFYHQSEFEDDNGYKSLDLALKEIDKKHGTQGNRIFYLSVQPVFFDKIIARLKKNGLIYDESNEEQRFSRVVIEKPFGHSFDSANDLQHSLVQHLAENQIYRIDHYLGKETVQNLLVFRFSNTIFEGLWNNRYIDHVQITVAEDIGIETRGAFYEEEGLFRDIIQNHLMQLVSLVGMEPPSSLAPNAIRDEKVKLLNAIEPMKESDFENMAIRGQYAEGLINGQKTKAYRQEDKVDPKSNQNTFSAMKFYIENWRWAGVPFYVRAGKRLPKRTTQIAVTFKKVPHILFNEHNEDDTPNTIVFRIQPDEGTSIKFNSKVPGQARIIQPVNMDFQYTTYFGKEIPEAYERLLYDAILGDSTLFARADESLTSWKLFTPLLNYWDSKPITDENLYMSGTWGTKKAEELMKKDGRQWNIL